jgi:hypothetical protein
MRLTLLSYALLGPALQSAGQGLIDLTGKPDATLGEPFTMVTGVRELPGNRAIVVDQFERTVFLVDFSAGARTQIGRQGDGPSEYRFPMTPHTGRGTSTLLYDATLRRINIVEADGSFAPSLTPPYGAVPGGLLSMRGVDAAGRLYFEGNSFNSETGRFTDSVPIIRWNPAGGVTETPGKVWSGGRVTIQREGTPASVARSILPFPHIDAWLISPDGRVVIVRQVPHAIGWIERDGSVRFGTPIPHTPIAVNAAERAAYRERHAATRMSAAGGPQTRRAPPVSDESFPPTMPAFIASSVIASPDGAIWIGRSHRAAASTWRYDRFDAQGNPTGSATIAIHSRIVGFGEGTVYVARTDPSDDLVYLERHRIR